MSLCQLVKIESDTVRKKFAGYPEDVLGTMLFLREVILGVVKDHDLGPVTESLTWKEPSYRTNHGTTLRMDWTKGEYRVYFNCQTKLVETFKEIYPDTFQYHTLRAVSFADIESIEAVLPELKQCIRLALTYHSIKHLPLLGA